MKVVIIGARADGHGKVVLEILEAMTNIQVAGFLDDNPTKTNINIRGYPVLGTTDDLAAFRVHHGLAGAIVAIADNARRREIAAKVRASGLQLVNAIHPTVHLDSDVELGEGNVLCQGVIIVAGTRIGNCVNIHTGATIDHDNIIEDGANIGPGVHTAGRVHVGRDAFIGTGAVFIPDVSIGEGVIVGAGAVVIHCVPTGDKVVGVPARSTGKHGGENE